MRRVGGLISLELMFLLLLLSTFSLLVVISLLLLASTMSTLPFSEGSLELTDSFSLMMSVVLLFPLQLSFIPSLLVSIPSASLMDAVPFIEGSFELLELLVFVLLVVLLTSLLLLLWF